MCTRASARHEFSFHGWRDNPSLCHFSSVFLSHRLIELPGPGEIPVTYVLFSCRSFFFYPGGRTGRNRVVIVAESSSLSRRYGTSVAPKLDFFVQLFVGEVVEGEYDLRYFLSRPVIEISGNRDGNLAYSSLRNRRKRYSVLPRSSRRICSFRSLHLG